MWQWNWVISYLTELVSVALKCIHLSELSNVAEAWHTPNLTWRLGTDYHFNSKLTAAAELYGLGKMPALLADGTTRELKGTIDVNLSAVYRYNNLFNIFRRSITLQGSNTNDI